MTTPLIALEEAFWAYINGQAAYGALGLKEFRGFDGNFFPFDLQKGLFPKHALPGHYAVNEAVGSGRVAGSVTGQVIANRFLEVVRLDAGLVFATQANDRSRSPIENAYFTLSDILHTWQAQSTKLGSGVILSDFEWEADSPKPYWSREQPGIATHWFWPYRVTLRGHERSVY